MTHIHSSWFKFTANRVVDITITAVSDWDDDTPKGSTLDTKFIFISASPDQFLKNGYKLDKQLIEDKIKSAKPEDRNLLEYHAEETLYTTIPIYDLLSNIRFEDYKLMGVKGCWFVLTPIDKLAEGAEINIQVTMDNGKILNYKVIC